MIQSSPICFSDFRVMMVVVVERTEGRLLMDRETWAGGVKVQDGFAMEKGCTDPPLHDTLQCMGYSNKRRYRSLRRSEAVVPRDGLRLESRA